MVVYCNTRIRHFFLLAIQDPTSILLQFMLEKENESYFLDLNNYFLVVQKTSDYGVQEPNVVIAL